MNCRRKLGSVHIPKGLYDAVLEEIWIVGQMWDLYEGSSIVMKVVVEDLWIQEDNWDLEKSSKNNLQSTSRVDLYSQTELGFW